jgi:hypothetical protein
MEATMKARLKQVIRAVASTRARLEHVMALAVVSALAAGVAFASGCGSSGGGGSSSTTAASTTGTSTSAPAAPSASDLAPVHGSYSPSIDPASFVDVIDNRYFPLKPGTAFHYKGVAEDGKTPQTDDEVVTHQTKQIMGVSCTVIRDTVYQRGKLVERTFDWYAQDKYGNVWYMGELAREADHGKLVRASDSWQGGVAGAQPGIIMPGAPHPGDEYRQEYYPGHALDQARVLGSGGSLKVPSGSYGSTLLTEETAPKLDPGVRERKYYVAGVGDIKEQTVSGNQEQIQLVSVTH